MRRLFVVGCLVAFTGFACNKTDTDPAAKVPDEGKAAVASAAANDAPLKGSKPSGDMFSGFDAKAELAALQGSWKVRDSAMSKDKSDWTIKGNKLTTKKGEAVREGELSVVHPGSLAFSIKKGSGSTTVYSAFARNGQDVYIGLGTAGVKVGDKYMVGVDDGVVIKTASDCKYYKKKFMSKKFDANGVDVKCEVTGEADKQVLSYEVPDRFNKGKMKQEKVSVVGAALLNDQMKGHKADKAEAAGK